jgi:hypothetical protein
MNTPHAAIAHAAEQGGVIRRQQALAVGMTARQIDLRVRAGDWRPLMAGGYRLLDMDKPLDRVRAAVALLPDAVASHFTAAGLLGFGYEDEIAATVLVHSRTTHTFPGVRVFRCHDLLNHHVAVINGLPVTTAARTLVDVSALVSRPRLEHLVDAAVASRSVDVGALRSAFDEVARRGKPGVAQMREVLNARIGEPASTSVLEIRGNRLLVTAGIDGFETEYAIPWAPGRRFDVAFPDQRVAIEWDSRRWHSQVDAFDSDRQRDRTASVNGWHVIRFTWRDVHDQPDAVVNTMLSLLDA